MNPEEKINILEHPQKGLETYASDMAEAMRKEEGSVIKIAMAEKKRREEEDGARSPGSNRNLVFIGASVVCILIGILIAYYALHLGVSRVPTQGTPAQTQALIYSETAKEISIDGMQPDALVAALQKEEGAASLLPGTVENIYLTTGTADTKMPISSQSFFSLLQSQIPQSLSPALNQKFMLGIYAGDKNSIFMLFKTDSPDTSTAGMLAWEPKMFTDLFALYGIPVSGAGSELLSSDFTDTIIQNKNSRAIKDASGNIILYYSFIDSSTLLIATDSKTMGAITSRLYSKNIEHTVQ